MHAPYLKHVKNALSQSIMKQILQHQVQWEHSKMENHEGVHELDLNKRRGDRAFIREKKLIETIWYVIKDHIPDTCHANKMVGPNSQMTLLRYSIGDYFKMHYDGDYENEEGHEALMTVQMYIEKSHDLEGGGTTFFDDDGVTIHKKVQCVPGDAIIFDHDWLHQGDEVRCGHKMALRLDIMYLTK